MNRAAIKTLIRTYLGTSDDDPAYSDTILNPVVQDAVDSILNDIERQNPSYLVKPAVTLQADGAASHNYTLATQSPAITDFARFLELRFDDEDGTTLTEARVEELRDAGSDYFAITGADESAVFVTSADSPAGNPLYLRYAYWPTELASDSSSPTGIPGRFHGVIALESLFAAFGLGGEQRLPRELHDRWLDRRSQLMAHVGHRGTQNSRSRVVPDDF